MTCPVCHFEHIPRESDSCPQCDSDLVCFKLLEALPDVPDSTPAPSGNADKQTVGREASGSHVGRTDKSKIPWFVFVLVGIILTLFCFWGYTDHRFGIMESKVQKIDTDMGQVKNIVNMNPNIIIKQIEAGTRQINHLEKRVEELVERTKENELKSLPGEPEIEMVSKTETISKPPGNQNSGGTPCFKIYRAKDEDSLWTIARDLYGSGTFYPILLENNPDLHIYSIGSKDSMRYLCDTTRAAQVYKTIIGHKQNRPFWKYRVRSGDTRKGIIKRYCLNQKDCLVEDKPLEPGMTMGVFLE